VTDHAARRARALEQIAAAGLDGLLVTPGPDLAYLTEYGPMPLERLTILLLALAADPVLVIPALEAPGAEDLEGMRGVELVRWTDNDDPYDVLSARMPAGRFAVTDRTWSSHLLALQRVSPERRFVAAGEAVPLLRAVKDAGEIERLRAAGRGADETFAAIVGVRFAGRRELDIAADLDRLLREHGHSSVEFTIVGSGPNSASPHHDPTDRVIAPGDAVVLDFGGIADGYSSDFTRTVFVGEPTREQATVHGVVKAAQQAAFDAIRPGVAAQDVDRAARAVIADAGYGEAFLHRTGHGIGMEVHEPPYIVEGNELPLEAGMTFSDEPGIYLAGRFGVRIEDQVAVTADGAGRLNDATRDAVVVS
jgi:Xaa-Pro aminopeptidase